MSKTLNHLDDLVPDAKNANRGTERGRYMVEHSLEPHLLEPAPALQVSLL